LEYPVCYLEYNIVIYGIFISHFLSDRKLTINNIDAEENVLQHHLDCFKQWDDAYKSKHHADKEWVKHFLAMQTYHNLQVQIFRFLGYCQHILSLGVSYVPYKHFNQSTIKALFSYVHGTNRDYVTSYGAAVSINNLVNSKKALSKNNKYYSQHILGSLLP
jgi:phage terminase large subunit-like protein